ncbi:hypothetical protein A3715_18115 [Oleiphilus sp. HI0009]|nr:hypothetical protein A3715_18115 [Oleiphilus sp. HI0009]
MLFIVNGSETKLESKSNVLSLLMGLFAVGVSLVPIKNYVFTQYVTTIIVFISIIFTYLNNENSEMMYVSMFTFTGMLGSIIFADNNKSAYSWALCWWMPCIVITAMDGMRDIGLSVHFIIVGGLSFILIRHYSFRKTLLENVIERKNKELAEYSSKDNRTKINLGSIKEKILEIANNKDINSNDAENLVGITKRIEDSYGEKINEIEGIIDIEQIAKDIKQHASRLGDNETKVLIAANTSRSNEIIFTKQETIKNNLLKAIDLLVHSKEYQEITIDTENYEKITFIFKCKKRKGNDTASSIIGVASKNKNENVKKLSISNIFEINEIECDIQKGYSFDSISISYEKDLEKLNNVQKKTSEKALSICLVEENNKLQSVLRKMLEQKNYAVSIARNIKSAEDLLNTFKLDVFIIDQQGSNDKEIIIFIENIKMKLPEASIIVVTENANEQYLKRLYEAGMSDFIENKIKKTALYARLEECVDKKRYQRELKATTKKLSEQLTKNEQQASKLMEFEKERVIGLISGGVLHGINTPLSVIEDSTDWINSELPSGISSNIKNEFNYISQSIGDIQQYLSDLRRFSRNDGNVEQDYFNIKEIIEVAIRMSKAPNNMSELMIDLEDGKIYGAQNGLIQIFINLIFNANDAIIEASRKGVISIKGRKNVNNYSVFIKDNGCGIEPDEINKIFDPYFTTKEVGKGTGVGLMVVKQYIKMYSGEILVESEVGKGTIFELRFQAK